MRRPPTRHLRTDPPIPAAPVALALAALVGLGVGRWWLARSPAPLAPAVDAGSFVTAIAPMLRRAGCASPACHGARAPMRLGPSPTTAAGALAELAAVRPFVGRGDPTQSALWLRATSATHAGAGALSPAGCEARALARWIAGAAVRTCAPPLPDRRP